MTSATAQRSCRQAVVGHRDIGHQDVGPQSPEDLQGLFDRRGSHYQRPAVLQSDAQHVARVVGVLHDQDVNAVKFSEGHGSGVSRGGAVGELREGLLCCCAHALPPWVQRSDLFNLALGGHCFKHTQPRGTPRSTHQ